LANKFLTDDLRSWTRNADIQRQYTNFAGKMVYRTRVVATYYVLTFER